MALTLIPPGKRKGNKFYVARGSIDGRLHEISTHEIDARKAASFARRYEADVRAEGAPADAARVTFAHAVERYVEFRKPSEADLQRLERIKEAIGKRRLRDLKPADFHDLAARLKPRGSPQTKNREVLRPAVTVMHHAANAGLCPWLKVRAFPEPPRLPRAIDTESAAAVIAAAPEGAKRRLIVWLFFQGTRISRTLAVEWGDIDFERRTVSLYNAKGKRFETFALQQATLDELAHVPEADRVGRVFPWATKSGVYKWLRPLVKATGVPFTPHVARHTLGTTMAANGETLRAIMTTLGHSQASSALIYQKGEIEVARAAAARVSYKPKPKTRVGTV